MSYEWMDQALCAQIGGSNWFDDEDGDYNAAKRICGNCPVKQQCGDFAQRHEGNVAHSHRYGTWGGQRPRQRAHKPAGRLILDAAEVIRLTNAEWSAQQIADKYGCSTRTVVRVRNRSRQEAA